MQSVIVLSVIMLSVIMLSVVMLRVIKICIYYRQLQLPNDASRIVIDISGAMLQIVVSLTDNSRGVIYDPRGIIYTHWGCL
jgi:hypothetical protein